MSDPVIIIGDVPPQPAPPATAYYLSKVYYERRIKAASLAAWMALDAIRVNVQNRPADWPTNKTAPWPEYVGYSPDFVPAVCDYILSDQVNVMDPAQASMLGLIQEETQAFGADAATAQAVIAQILNPAPAPGEI
jgi:hypothetical protein